MRKTGAPTTGRSILLCLLALCFMAAARTTARADEVYIAGFTNGCFTPFATCTAPNTTSPSISRIFGLTFRQGSFLGTTVNGVRAIGGTNPDSPAATPNNLGSFELTTEVADYNNFNFVLLVTFTAPQQILGSQSRTFNATLTGGVRSDNQGGVIIDFDNTPILISFIDNICEPDPTGGVPGQQTTCGSGSFLFSVNDLALDPGQTVTVTGQIRAAQQVPVQTPEPASLVLLGSGLSLAAAAARRRRARGG